MNFAKFLRTPFFTEYLQWLPLPFRVSVYIIEKPISRGGSGVPKKYLKMGGGRGGRGL